MYTDLDDYKYTLLRHYKEQLDSIKNSDIRGLRGQERYIDELEREIELLQY